MNIPKDGVQIKHNDVYQIGELKVHFELGQDVNQMEELCHMYNAD